MIGPLMAKIQATLDTVPELAFTYDYSRNDIKGFPCAVYTPISFTNEFLTNQENFKGYSFRIQLFAETEVAGRRTGLQDILVPAFDAVIEAFDRDWNMGVDVGGHRIWAKIESGEWGFGEESVDGNILVAELILTVNQANNIN